jgi:Tol biopolymer transport system component
MPLSPAGNSATPPDRLLASTRYEVSPSYSPDGKRIAFSSNRAGVRQIWVANADSSDPVALTNFTQGIAGSPKWSPDGQTIVFDARPSGLADIYSVKADGGTPVRLTDNPAEDHVPCYSADGRWIFFASTRSGQRQLYRMPAGGGNAIQITQKGGIVPAASPDGRWVYYSTPGQGIWKVSVDGGEETMVLPQQKMWASAFSFAVTSSGIYFAGPIDPASQSLLLLFYAFENGQTTQVGRFEKPLALGFSVSPDRKWLLFTQLDSSMEDLMLVENFR